MTCELCCGDGRRLKSRDEFPYEAGGPPRESWWAVPCSCSAGRQWDRSYSSAVPIVTRPAPAAEDKPDRAVMAAAIERLRTEADAARKMATAGQRGPRAAHASTGITG